MSLQMLSMLSWLLPHSAAVRMLRCDAICPTRTTLLKELRQKKHQRTSCVQRMLQEREEFRGRLRQWQPMWARNSPTCAGKRWKKPSLSECPFRATDCMRSLGPFCSGREAPSRKEVGTGPRAGPPARPTLVLASPSPQGSFASSDLPLHACTSAVPKRPQPGAPSSAPVRSAPLRRPAPAPPSSRRA